MEWMEQTHMRESDWLVGSFWKVVLGASDTVEQDGLLLDVL